MVKKDCFAYRETENGGNCIALKEIDCERCAFYKAAADEEPKKRKKYRARLTNEEKEEIIRLYKEGVSKHEIARRFKIAHKSILTVVKRYEEGKNG